MALTGYSRSLLRNSIKMIILILSAGSGYWCLGWIYFILNFGFEISENCYMDKELCKERHSMGSREGSQRWDKVLIEFRTLLHYVIILIGGLNYRYSWTKPFPIILPMIGIFMIIIGNAIRIWAQTNNKFFSSIVRIQKDRGHKVCTTGPYSILRHPGYFGSTLISLATPLILDCIYLYGFSAIFGILHIIRIIKEEEVLMKELDDYKEYTKKVKYRKIGRASCRERVYDMR